jgi:hypothetical protein
MPGRSNLQVPLLNEAVALWDLRRVDSAPAVLALAFQADLSSIGQSGDLGAGDAVYGVRNVVVGDVEDIGISARHRGRLRRRRRRYWSVFNRRTGNAHKLSRRIPCLHVVVLVREVTCGRVVGLDGTAEK